LIGIFRRGLNPVASGRLGTSGELPVLKKFREMRVSVLRKQFVVFISVQVGSISHF
jgi:hypothetical protein